MDGTLESLFKPRGTTTTRNLHHGRRPSGRICKQETYTGTLGFFGAMRKLEIGFFILQKWFGTAPKYPKDSGLKLIVPICHRKDPSKKNSAAAGFTSASWAEVMSVFQEFDGVGCVEIGPAIWATAQRSRLRWASAVGWVSLRKLRNWPSFCNKRCPSATPNVFATLTLGGVGVVPRLFQSGKDGSPHHDPEKGPQMDFFSWWRIPNTSRKMTVWGRKNSDVSKSRWDAEVLGR